MSDLYDLNDFWNGRPGAGERMTSGFAGLGFGFRMLNRYPERHALRLDGTGEGLDMCRRAVDAASEWVEGCLDLPETLVSGVAMSPFVPSLGRYLVGDGLNFPPERLKGWHRGDETMIHLDRAILIGGRGAGTYGHWLLDFVPQILTALAAETDPADSLPILVVNCPAFGKRFLRYLGLEQRCIFVRPDQTYRIDHLQFPLITKLRRRYSVEVLRKSYGHLFALADRAAEKARGRDWRRLLVARRIPPFCSNFDALQAALEPLGFTVIHPEDFPLAEQFQLFAHAEIVVGEDGSAMHNAGFCRPDTPIVIWSRSREEKLNAWHGAVAETARAPLSYLQSTLSDDDTGYAAPVDDILRVIAAL